MRRFNGLALLKSGRPMMVLLAVGLFGSSCGERTGPFPYPETGAQPTLSSLQDRLFRQLCVGLGCHSGATPKARLDLSSLQLAEKSLLGADGRGAPSCMFPMGFKRVEPGNAAASLIFLKVSGRLPTMTPDPGCIDAYDGVKPLNDRMPLDDSDRVLDQSDIEVLRTWIDVGAPLK
jgi:hypothetical protein